MDTKPTTKQLRDRSAQRLESLKRDNAPSAIIKREQKQLDNLTRKERNEKVIHIQKGQK